MVDLVTGFGPFNGVEENPSAWLAERSNVSFQVLEVSFRAVDAFLQHLASTPHHRILLLGVHGRARIQHQEMFARNLVGPHADVLGETREGIMEGPPVVGSTLFRGKPPVSGMKLTFDAGTYLCNYIYYQALLRLPDRQFGFLHVPRFELMPAERQLDNVRGLIALA